MSVVLEVTTTAQTHQHQLYLGGRVGHADVGDDTLQQGGEPRTPGSGRHDGGGRLVEGHDERFGVRGLAEDDLKLLGCGTEPPRRLVDQLDGVRFGGVLRTLLDATQDAVRERRCRQLVQTRPANCRRQLPS